MVIGPAGQLAVYYYYYYYYYYFWWETKINTIIIIIIIVIKVTYHERQRRSDAVSYVTTDSPGAAADRGRSLLSTVVRVSRAGAAGRSQREDSVCKATTPRVVLSRPDGTHHRRTRKSACHVPRGERKCAENYNKYRNRFLFLTAISILVNSNHNSFRVLFDRIASVYFILKNIFLF